MPSRIPRPLLALCLILLGALPARAADAPTWLPQYVVDIDLDVSSRRAHVVLQATWTNMQPAPTDRLVFNAHSRYVVPDKDIGLMAKTLELLRVQAGEALGDSEPALDVQGVRLDGGPGHAGVPLAFHYEGDTKTTLVVPLDHPVGPGQSVTVTLDITMRLPPKQGRWGQWRDVSFLSNWLPVFAFYGPPPYPRPGEPEPTAPPGMCWQPTPFVPWHQPFFNEAGNYHVRVRLPCEQKVACTGSIVDVRPLADGRQELQIEAPGVRDFALLCSAKYVEFCSETEPAPGVPRVKVHVLALPGHEHYAREMARIAVEALTRYSQWFGPYPYPEFTIAESFFGWNGNECAGLVMIDERVFGMPHLAGGYVEYLVSHETCHQWFYNLVGTDGYRETFMDEAFATYFAHRLLNEKFGRNNKLMNYPAGLEWLPNIHREDYRHYGLYGTIGRGEEGAVIRDMEKFDHVINLFSHAYDKGSHVLAMIEDRLGEAAFMDFMRRVVCRYRYRIIRVADFRHELEEYTHQSWEKFFADWLYGSGLTDWAVADVDVSPPPLVAQKHRCPLDYCRRRDAAAEAAGLTRVVVVLDQKAELDEPTTLGITLPGQSGYPIRLPILPGGGKYQIPEPPTTVEPLGPHRWRVETLLPDIPEQITVDPDQILVDRNPANNFWKQPVRCRVTPLYTFLDETDLTNAYDRWNVIFGPWVYSAAVDDAWYTRSTMLGVRAGVYRTQEFSGGAYAAYRTDFRDFVVGIDGLWDHYPDAHFQTGFNLEQRLATFYNDDSRQEAFRGVLFERYILQYGSSLYLPPMQYVEAYAAYQEDFLPTVREPVPGGQRPERQTTAGLHYRIDYLTPYWDPEGGFKFDVWAEGGVADLSPTNGIGKLSGQFSTVKCVPDLSAYVGGVPLLGGAARWLGDTRLAVRVYGATAAPSRGEFFTMGGGTLFRGFDQAERQGSTVWVGSVEWRVPLAKGLTLDCLDHVVGLRNVYGAAFYDVGDAYTNGHSAGPVAHAVGGGLRLDVAWFGFVERTVLRFDVAKAVNMDTSTQFWFGVMQPF